MDEIVVIDGEIELENTLDGEVELDFISDLDPDVLMQGGGGAAYPHYDGVYEVTPSESTQTLDTDGKVMDDDVTVNPIPSQYVVPTGTKQINIASNGTVTEDVTNYADAEINVNVPASAVDSGTKSINSNGTHDVVGYANTSVNVPNSYSASDEGKVVSNGALVAQTSDTVTTNDTYDTTLINSLTVNVSGGQSLPTGYTSCNYIQSSGDAYIDTGVHDVGGGMISGYWGKFAGNVVADKYLWGYQGTQVSTYRFTSMISSANVLKYYGAQSGASNDIGGWDATNAHEITVDTSTSNNYPVFTVDNTNTTGTKKYTTLANATQPNIYLMAGNYQGAPLQTDLNVDGSYIRCYGFKIFSFGGAIRDFVPCVRNADSVAGFYDYITKAFYPSIGNNAFTYA